MQQPSPAPLHGVTSASGTSYAYDAAGDRTNAGSATAMTWDAERRLTGWTSGSGATTGSAAYDGEGNRVALQTITTSAPPPQPGRVKPLGPVGYTSTTSITYYVLGLEDVTGGVLTKYLGAGAGLPSAVRVGTTLSYLASDGIGSVTEALDTAGNVTAQQLYAPYGRVRYSVGALPTTKGYAGQRQDASSGLNDAAARYYDASTEQFASADTASDAGNGLDRLAYVGGNPETRTDPTGHSQYCGTDCTSGGTGTGSGGTCTSDANCNGGYSGGGQTGGNNTGCGTNKPCPKSKSTPDQIKKAWDAYYERQKANVNVGTDKLHIVLDIAFFLADLAMVFAGIGTAVLSVITDILAIVADFGQFVKDQSLADGNTVNAAGASRWGGVLNTLSLIGNVLNAGWGILSIFTGWEGIVKKGAKEVAGRVIGILGSGVEAVGAGQNLTIDSLDANELRVDQMNDSQLQNLGLPPSN